MKNKNARYTQGPVGRLLFKNSLAMLPGTIAISGYNIVDTYFVGQLGRDPLAAMGFTFPVVMMLGCIFHGLAVGVATPVSQMLGKNKHGNASRLVNSGIILLLGASVLAALFGILTQNVTFRALGADGEVLRMVEEYMIIWYLGCATASLSGMGNSVLLAGGSARSAGVLMTLGMLCNTALDPLFIFTFGWGIKGAALATVVSQFLVLVLNFNLLWRRHKLIAWERIPWPLLRTAWGEIMRFAVPGAVSMIMLPTGAAVLTRLTAKFGYSAVAASAAAMRLEVVAFILPMSFGMTLVPVVGQNYGAMIYSRIRECYRFVMGFAMFFLLSMAVVFYIGAPFAADFFSTDPEVRRIMVDAMRITAWGFCMNEVLRFSCFFYNGTGQPAMAVYLNFYRIFILLLPLSLIAYFFDSLNGLFFARLATDWISGVTGAILAWRMVRRLPHDGERCAK